MLPIRALDVHDAEAYLALRIEGLEREPLAFGTSAEEQRAMGGEKVAERLVARPNGNFTLGAFSDGMLVGTVGYVGSERVKTRHVGGVVGMFVTPVARRQGAGRGLLQALIECVRGYGHVERLELSVSLGAEGARALYRSVGFVPYGVQPHAIKVGDAYADLEHMTLSLRTDG